MFYSVSDIAVVVRLKTLSLLIMQILWFFLVML